jgi:tetratricopeptide (TPR) repeat protein/DNA-binding CsgD family transcriptional regulator
MLVIVQSSNPLPAQSESSSDSLAARLAYAVNPGEKIEILLELTNILKNNQPDMALLYASEADDMAMQLTLQQKELEAKVLLADIYWGMSDYRLSMEYAMVSLDIAKKQNSVAQQAEANRILGKIYTDLGDYQQSSDYYFESLKLIESIEDREGTGRALNSIGYLYFEQKNYQKALEYYKKSLQIAREINDKMGISRGLNNVAAVHANLEEYEIVESYIHEAIKINIEIGQRLWEGVNYLNLGVIYQDQKVYDTSLFFHKKAEGIFTELNNMPKLASSYLNLSDYYNDIACNDSSFYYAQKALNLGQVHQLKKAVHESANKLHDLFKSNNMLDSAYKYGMLQYAMKDSLDLDESLTNLSKLELQYEFEKQAQDKKLKQQRKDFLTIILFILLVSVIIVVLLILARQRANARNANLARLKLEDEVNFKSKELTINVMNLIAKNELLTEISNKLIDIQDSAIKDETKSAILQIARDIKRSTENQVWEEFELRFKEVHGDFYETLISQFPDLSPNEQKLCAFLRLNLSSKEISEMTGQRVNTIEMARHRLRKKLGISNTQANLIAFLSQI